MSNLLNPEGLLPRRQQQILLQAIVHDAVTEPMPDHVGAWIQTEKCIWQLTHEELGHGLGIPKDWDYPSLSIDPSTATSVFHWEYVGHSFTLEADIEGWPLLKLLQPSDLPDDSLPMEKVLGDDYSSKREPFPWHPPDLSIDGVWYQ